MKAFQYQVFSGEINYEEDQNPSDLVLERLNKIGREGWEIIDIFEFNPDVYPYGSGIFHRRVARYSVFCKREVDGSYIGPYR